MKHEPNEMVVLELAHDDKIQVTERIHEQVAKFGYMPAIKFAFMDNWPMDKNHPPTLAQLVVIARVMKFRIVISSLSLEPLRDGTG